MELKRIMKKQFDESIQAFTGCQICGQVKWCVMHDNGKELCEDCYLL